MGIIITEQHRIPDEQVKMNLRLRKNTVKFSIPPDTIILHYTAGASAESSVVWLADENVKASAHVVIGRDGEYYQLVPFDTIAWHAGPSAHGGRTGFNQFAIGIELDNAGFLAPLKSEYVSAFGKYYPREEVVKAVHRNEQTARFWHKYTEPQLEACYALCQELVTKYPIKQILGHEEICPGVKFDPGPAFPLDEFRRKLLSDTKHKEL